MFSDVLVHVQAASAELRESAAEGLGELVDITSEETLKPFVVQITGVCLTASQLLSKTECQP